MRGQEQAQASYERALREGPPEPPTADIPVTYEVWIRKDQPLTALTEVLGGEAHWAGDETRRESCRPAAGSTVIEEVESVEAAEGVMQALMDEHLSHLAETDDAVITGEEPPEPDEPDWDAIRKDRRIEEDMA